MYLALGKRQALVRPSNPEVVGANQRPSDDHACTLETKYIHTCATTLFHGTLQYLFLVNIGYDLKWTPIAAG